MDPVFFVDLDFCQLDPPEEPIKIPRPDERSVKYAPKKFGVVKPPKQQSAFAAQNLEDLAFYDVDTEDCGECGRKITYPGHYT